MEIAADNELTVYADQLALTVVLRNLIVNGIDAAAGTENATVTIEANKVNSKTVVEVSDNGRGFHPAEGEKLFEKFYRLGNEIRREGRGAEDAPELGTLARRRPAGAAEGADTVVRLRGRRRLGLGGRPPLLQLALRRARRLRRRELGSRSAGLASKRVVAQWCDHDLG